jgi:signal transduction histidine kinase
MQIEDTGVGIAEEDQQVIFEKFRQGSTGMPSGDAMTREYSGTGLGLSIVKELCKLLGGEIVLVSELGKGSEFTIRIPWRYREPRREINMGDTLDGLSLTDGPIAGQTSVAPGPSLGIGDP